MKTKIIFIQFAVCITLATIIFRYCLSNGINNHNLYMIWGTAIAYFFAMFFSGYYFGRKQYEFLPINSISFSFHATTFAVFAIVSELWFALKLNSHYENVRTLNSTLIIWGIFLLLHFLVFIKNRKSSINGLNRSDIFE